MKKIVLFAAAGLMSLAACQEKAGYIIKGTAEGVADGDTVFLQTKVWPMVIPYSCRNRQKKVLKHLIL